MNYATIKALDVANGPGLRVSLFVSGCTHHCEGCFNQEAWDFTYGEKFTNETIKEILSQLNHPWIKGLSLLGGEPFEYVNQKKIIPLLRAVSLAFPDKDIWCYTGYDFQRDILGYMHNLPETRETVKEMLQYIDVLVDGEFILEQKNANLRFKGSENQRIIKVRESLEQDKIILWEG